MPAKILNYYGRAIPDSLYGKLEAKRVEIKKAKAAQGGTSGAGANFVFFEGEGPGLGDYAFTIYEDLHSGFDFAFTPTAINVGA